MTEKEYNHGPVNHSLDRLDRADPGRLGLRFLLSSHGGRNLAPDKPAGFAVIAPDRFLGRNDSDRLEVRAGSNPSPLIFANTFLRLFRGSLIGSDIEEDPRG